LRGSLLFVEVDSQDFVPHAFHGIESSTVWVEMDSWLRY
jgi:hypothetical protein